MIYSLHALISHIFLPLIFPSTITSLFNKRLWLPLISGKVSVAATNSSPLMHQLPNHIVEKIFENLCTADRVRMMLVSKSWRRILMRDDIPIAPEAPWLIFSNDPCQKPEYFLSEISFKSSSEERTYRFKLPGKINNNGKDKWCCCGSSNGWLLIAVGQNLYTTDMYLWNPVSGQTKTLPPLSTLPFFNEIVDDVIEESGAVGNISCFISSVQVFPIGNVECVVAIIFFFPTFYEQYHQLALCTPHDQSWIAVGGEDGRILYNDMLFHNEKLYASCRLLLLEEEEERVAREVVDNDGNRKVVYTAHLAGGCDVEVIMYRFSYNDVALAERPGEIPLGVSIYKRIHVVEHLVQSCLTGELLVVSAIQDLYSYNTMEEDDHRGSIQKFSRCQTEGFEVRRLTGGCLENMSGSIGEQGIYVGCYGSLSLPAYVNKVEADSINFATCNDGMIVGVNRLTEENFSWDKLRIGRLHGIFNVQENTIQITSMTNLPIDSGSINGWFTPKLFQNA